MTTENTAVTLSTKSLSEAGINLSVTKADLIDLVKDTLEEQLETQQEAHNEAFKEFDERWRKLGMEREEALIAKFKKDPRYNKFLDKLNNAIAGLSDVDFVNKETVKEMKWTLEVYVDNRHASCGGRCVVGRFVCNGAYRNINITDFSQVLTNEELAAKAAERNALEKESRRLHKMAEDLKKNTRAAKMQIIRAALGNSEDGKKLLTMLEGNTRLSTKMIQATTNAVEEIKVVSKSQAKRIAIQKDK